MSLKLGCNISTFDSDTRPADLFTAVLDQALAAERAGFDVLTIGDHLHATPGAPDEPTLEAYTTLAALASRTSSIQLSTMVSSNTFRNPAVLAKMVTSLDVISGGRAVLGIGAGWFEPEHDGYGLEFHSLSERMAKFEEALRIIVPMLRGDRPTMVGKWYRVREPINEPRMRDDLPVLVGGGGERRTFAYAARYADHLNITCLPAQLPDKLRAFDARCAEVGRDPRTLEVSFATPMVIDEDGAKARQQAERILHGSGVDPAMASEVFFVGTPDEVTEQLRTKVLAHGVRRLMVNLFAAGQDPDVIALAGRTLAPLVAAA
ncbi:TIGR03560 family F420-dependent LLM class oxidoreductase [Nocardia miyunensis]|uniref:TIGR03560 family F420-dependent LLM class oxidoreductase n=1 Tax=Nocardia miyunensis TaxID=282684 RepID=UPI00082A0C56|nr:TIGR03560 family F420-dependent LLM class oxidoreductase [Nocardia miyunensis]